LSPQAEILRFEFPINGYIHLIAILNFPLIFILLIDLFKYSKFKSSFYKKSIYSLFGISCVFSLGMGGRGTIVIFLLYIFIAATFLRRISTIKVFLVAVIGLYFLGLLKLVRDYAFYGDTVLDDIAQNWIFGENKIMMPFYFSYLGMVMNFSVLDAYVIRLNEFFYGYFTLIKPIIDLTPGNSYNMIDLQREVLNIQFHGTLTNTILGKPFIDFGYFGSIIMFIIGLLAGREFWLVVKYGLLRNILPYSFLYAQILMGIYTYTFGSFHILLYLLIIKVAGSYFDRKILLQNSLN
jgi:oligosaccharide repeat unit polymerase